MKTVTFCYPDYSQPTSLVTPTFTGPAWLNLELLQGEIISEMARCPSVLLADTIITIDLKRPRDARVFVVPMHNASDGDLARVRFATDAAFNEVVLDSGWIEFYGTVYPWGALPWGHPSWWDGRLTDEDAAGYVIPWMYTVGESVVGQFVEWSFDFTTNPAGVCDVGRLVVSPAFSPVWNVSCGIQFGWNDGSKKQRSKGGAAFKDRATKYRTARMQLEWLETNEAYGGLWEMMRRHGVTEPFFFIFDTDEDASLRLKRSFMCAASALDPASRSR